MMVSLIDITSNYHCIVLLMISMLWGNTISSQLPTVIDGIAQWTIENNNLLVEWTRVD